MNRPIARLGLVVALAGAVLSIRTDARAATCTGDDNCRACKNCRYCRHCAQLGGTCGICKRAASARKGRVQRLKVNTHERQTRG